MPIVPRGTKVTAVPWNIPDIPWQLPTLTDWDDRAAWLSLVNWRPNAAEVWWQYFEKVTNTDFEFTDGEARSWAGGSETTPDEYLFIFLGPRGEGEFAGFVVLKHTLMPTEDDLEKLLFGVVAPLDAAKIWQDAYHVTDAQYEAYADLIHQNKKINAIKLFRAYHNTSLMLSKNAIDQLSEILL